MKQELIKELLRLILKYLGTEGIRILEEELKILKKELENTDD